MQTVFLDTIYEVLGRGLHPLGSKAKDPDQEQAEAFHEQYRFLVETLKADAVSECHNW